ncbi:RusA family crossover junction endodeoxyribonuclease (plasmid) [Dyella sp. BiH032]|uniref:RusA family crossover junction endodeoxyribonuclease n=1 Tax=Dyella sp. BiH032 TaxID=3075430 RepID=UPI002893714F|nr:RusA family crossover junction endodeoxyribonuclease [Dyella sp. BiH032]WNL48484.1 RusA family crossover junction endodeoxyribonuclease [Dyella sp. BiH032]
MRSAHGLSTAAPAPQPLPKLAQIAAPPPRARKRATAATLLANLLSATSEDADNPDTQMVDILVLGKPRMTQRDRWQKRPAALRYRAFCDELRLRQVRVPNRYGAICILPMPKSWSERTKEAMNGMPHLQKPDKDNIEKAIADALKANDQTIWDGAACKYWGYAPRLIIVRRDASSMWTVPDRCDPTWLPEK